MDVVVRVRPDAENEPKNSKRGGHFTVQDVHTVVVKPPANSHKRSLAKMECSFHFTHVFSESVSQEEFYDATTKRVVQDVLYGKSSLLFTYGVTNSGKTYTIQGTPREPGILIQALRDLFDLIPRSTHTNVAFRPISSSKLRPMAPSDVEQMDLLKKKLFRFARSKLLNVSAKKFRKYVPDLTHPSTRKQWKVAVSPSHAASPRSRAGVVYNIWVSFIEVYNDRVFDLLKFPSENSAPKSLKLVEDSDKVFFVKGAREIHVESAEEALMLFSTGKRNLHVAPTKLNLKSSRSHSLFNIRVVRINGSDPGSVQQTRLTFCDLAGSERLAKYEGSSSRKLESSKINSSLLVLSRCISALHWNQKHRFRQQLVPYRDSKLTHVLQQSLSTCDNMCMIVNINLNTSFFDDTFYVLRFSSLVQMIKKLPKRVGNTIQIEPNGTALTENNTSKPRLEGKRWRLNESVLEAAQPVRSRLATHVEAKILSGDDLDHNEDEDFESERTSVGTLQRRSILSRRARLRRRLRKKSHLTVKLDHQCNGGEGIDTFGNVKVTVVEEPICDDFAEGPLPETGFPSPDGNGSLETSCNSQLPYAEAVGSSSNGRIGDERIPIHVPSWVDISILPPRKASYRDAETMTSPVAEQAAVSLPQHARVPSVDVGTLTDLYFDPALLQLTLRENAKLKYVQEALASECVMLRRELENAKEELRALKGEERFCSLPSGRSSPNAASSVASSLDGDKRQYGDDANSMAPFELVDVPVAGSSSSSLTLVSSEVTPLPAHPETHNFVTSYDGTSAKRARLHDETLTASPSASQSSDSRLHTSTISSQCYIAERLLTKERLCLNEEEVVLSLDEVTFIADGAEPPGTEQSSSSFSSDNHSSCDEQGRMNDKDKVTEMFTQNVSQRIVPTYCPLVRLKKSRAAGFEKPLQSVLLSPSQSTEKSSQSTEESPLRKSKRSGALIRSVSTAVCREGRHKLSLSPAEPTEGPRLLRDADLTSAAGLHTPPEEKFERTRYNRKDALSIVMRKVQRM